MKKLIFTILVILQILNAEVLELNLTDFSITEPTENKDSSMNLINSPTTNK